MGWQRIGYGVGGLLALAVLFLGIVMLSNAGLRGVRLVSRHLARTLMACFSSF